MPNVPEIGQDSNSLPLESGAFVYIIANAKDARPVIDLLPIEELNDRQTKQMLDRTEFLAAALFPPESGLRFQIAAWGSYPNSQADMAFGFSRDWQKKRLRTGGVYWHSSASGLSIAMNSRQAFAASSLNSGIFEPVTSAPGVGIPEGFNEFRRDAILSCWMENPAPVINGALNKAGVPIQLPVQKLFVSLFFARDRYQAMIRLQFENSAYARRTASIISLAAGFAPNEIKSIFFANPLVQNGNYIDIKTGLLSEEVMVRFFDLFKFFSYFLIF